MALAVVLLAGASVMVRSFLNLSTAHLGVRSSGVTTMLLNLPQERYRDAARQIAFVDRLRPRLEAIAGVESVTFASALPGGAARRSAFEVAGTADIDPGRRPTISTLTIEPGYFKTLDVTVRSGRDFDELDRQPGAPVAIVNRQFPARRGRQPIRSANACGCSTVHLPARGSPWSGWSPMSFRTPIGRRAIR